MIRQPFSQPNTTSAKLETPMATKIKAGESGTERIKGGDK